MPNHNLNPECDILVVFCFWSWHSNCRRCSIVGRKWVMSEFAEKIKTKMKQFLPYKWTFLRIRKKFIPFSFSKANAILSKIITKHANFQVSFFCRSQFVKIYAKTFCNRRWARTFCFLFWKDFMHPWDPIFTSYTGGHSFFCRSKFVKIYAQTFWNRRWARKLTKSDNSNWIGFFGQFKKWPPFLPNFPEFETIRNFNVNKCKGSGKVYWTIWGNCSLFGC